MPWDTLKLYVLLDDPGSDNGIVRLWVNGELKLEHQDLDLRDDTGYTMNKLILSSYTSAESGGDGTQRYDSWLLSETDPSAGSGPASGDAADGRGRQSAAAA